MCRAGGKAGWPEDGAELLSERHTPPPVGRETFRHLTELTFKMGGPLRENELVDRLALEDDVGEGKPLCLNELFDQSAGDRVCRPKGKLGNPEEGSLQAGRAESYDCKVCGGQDILAGGSGELHAFHLGWRPAQTPGNDDPPGRSPEGAVDSGSQAL